jgi:flagellar biosynthesis chaperone FliJ
MESTENNKTNPAADNTIIRNKIKTAEKEGVRRGATISVIISLIVLLAAGITGYYLYRQDHNMQLALYDNQHHTFTQIINKRDSVINDWLVTFDQIEKDLALIKEKENIITLKSSDSEFSKDRKEQILGDIKYLNTLLDANKKKIASLSNQVKNSGNTIKGLETKIASFETRLKEYETNIAELKENLVKKDFEIGQLNTNLADLEVTVTQKDEMIASQTDKMNQAYLTTGTYKELKTKGIISKEGGFLGIGKTGTLSRDVNDNLFAKVDVRDTKTIPVNSRDVRLITKHPSDSYTIVYEGDKKVSRIDIKDPDNFWKVSRYAVVELIR